MPDTSRRPTFLERYYILRGVYGYYTNFNVAAQYSRRVLKGHLSHALKSLIAGNHVFAVNFVRTHPDDERHDGNNFLLEPLEVVHFSDVARFEPLGGAFGAETLRALDEVVIEVDTPQPLWRVVVYEGAEQWVVVCCNHALFDGTSARLFHDDLLCELDRTRCRLFEEVLYTRTAAAHVPAVNAAALALYRPSLLFLAGQAALRIVVPWVKDCVAHALARWGGDRYVKTWGYPIFRHHPTARGTKTHFKLIRVGPDDTRRLLARCRHHGFTLSPVLLVVALACLQGTLMAGGPASLDSVFAVNNRRYVSGAARAYGVMVLPCQVALPPLPPTFGELLPYIAHVRDAMAGDLDANFGSKVVGCLQYLNIGYFLRGRLGHHLRLTVDVSNLGANTLAHGEWAARDLVFSQLNGIIAHFGLNVIGLPQGLTIVFGYLQDYEAFPAELGRFVERFTAMLT